MRLFSIWTNHVVKNEQNVFQLLPSTEWDGLEKASFPNGAVTVSDSNDEHAIFTCKSDINGISFPKYLSTASMYPG